uniref:ras-related protein Rab-7L1 n=1 Tax=Myxine glutinosa TaxID=7769 RepID=UPI00358E8FE1
MVSHFLFKVLVVGDPLVGKTSFVQRYVNRTFSKHYRATVGVDFALKVLRWSNMETIRLQLWDVAGQERFASMTRLYYKDAAGCVLMFDVSSANTFYNCIGWKQDLDSKMQQRDGQAVPCILLANKCDLGEWAIGQTEVDKFSREHNFIGWMETSVKENRNIEKAVGVLVDEMMARASEGGQSVSANVGHLHLDYADGHNRHRCCWET